MQSELLVSIADGTMTIIINRPEAKNAVNQAVADGIAAAMDELDSNPSITAAVLTGAEGSFCAGQDLKAFVKGERAHVPGRGFAGVCAAPPQKPIIAAIEGHVLAGGFELALTCDLIVAAENSIFGLPEVKRGLVAGGGGLLRLSRKIPPNLAMQYVLTGESFTATRAYELGLVNKIVAPGQALEAAIEMARQIAANAPLATAASKKVMTEVQDWSLDEMFERQKDIILPLFSSEDALEGARAFAEKRPPKWSRK